MDGAPTEHMHASDLVADFWELGYELFHDRERFHASFYATDIFDTAASLFEAPSIPFDIVYVGSFMHLWDWAAQVEAGKAMVRLSRPGTLVVGCQMGLVQGTLLRTGWKNDTKTIYYHDAESIKNLWAEVAETTGTTWETTATLTSIEALLPEKRDYEWMGPNIRALMFEAVRSS